jgi:hypothetical protein
LLADFSLFSKLDRPATQICHSKYASRWFGY